MLSFNILAELKKDLREVASAFEECKKELRQDYQEELKDSSFLLSWLLLTIAKFGDYNFEKLKSSTLALEFFNLALTYHYNSKQIDNSLAIILGDFCYAKGINIATKAESVVTVNTLSQAIRSGISEGKSAAGCFIKLYEAASYLGAHLSKNKAILPLVLPVARKIGLLYLAKDGLSCQKIITSDGLKKLPDNQYRESLAYVLDQLG